MTVSIRSYLAAGVATAAVGAIAIVPIEQTAAQTIGARLYQLSSAVQPLVQPANAAAAVLGAISDGPASSNPAAATPNSEAAATTAVAPAAAVTSSASLPAPPPWIWPSDSLAQSAGDLIINVYNAFEPWFQWGWSVVAWAAGWVPIVGFFAQQINIAYATIEPLVGALVYSFAYLIDGQGALIPQTLTNGVAAAWNNFIQGEIAWFESFLPPLPPIGSIFGAAATAAPAPLAAAAIAESETPASGVAGFKDAHEVVADESGAPEADSTATATASPAADADSAPSEPVEAGPVETDQVEASPVATGSVEASPIEADTATPVAEPTVTAKPSNSSPAAAPDKADTADADSTAADKSPVAKTSGPKAKGHSPRARTAKAAQH